MQIEEALQAVTAENPEEASRIAVKIIREQKADIIMKGFVNTDVLLRAILDKEHGILPRGAVLTHITVTKIPEYPKLLFLLMQLSYRTRPKNNVKHK